MRMPSLSRRGSGAWPSRHRDRRGIGLRLYTELWRRGWSRAKKKANHYDVSPRTPSPCQCPFP